ERLEAGRIALVGQQVTGTLPAEHVERRIAPRRALVGLVAREEVQEQGRVVEGPAGATGLVALAATLEDLAEQPLARAAAEEHVLPRSMVIAVAGRDGDALDTERHGLIEEGRDVVRILATEERAVDGDAEAFTARQLDSRHRLVEHTFLANRLVVPLAAAV